GKMNLQLPSHNSSFTDLENETILVDVEELCRQISDSSTARNNPSQFSPATATGQETELSALLYPPLATYIKSLSHDSDSSSHTQTSLDTTVDYISSHGQVAAQTELGSAGDFFMSFLFTFTDTISSKKGIASKSTS
ncbi:hypothetical protein ATANTOWER_005125, partial [Ataeniobius toweri]|nr:hypothetical protein [Ataeniobius toweri]